jgi:cell division protein FtsB
MDDRAEELLADQKEDAAELAGLKARNYELRREVELLRLRSIDLAAENELLWDQLEQERSFIRAMADDVAAAG